MTQQRIKLLFIAGYERSGTTLLSRLLGQIDSVFAVGEMSSFWSKRLNSICGCKKPIRECPVWGRVAAEVDEAGVEADRIARLLKRTDNRNLPRVLMPGGKWIAQQSFKTLRANLAVLYGAIAKVSEARVIVDSSKTPLYGYLLGSLPNLEVTVVHMIRDPRGVQYSLQKRRDGGHSYYANNYRPARSIVVWNLVNLAAHRLWQSEPRRYVPIRYEDFMDDPLHWIHQICERLQIPSESVPVIRADRSVEMKPTHSILGAHRFDVGRVRLQADVAWRDGLDAGTQLQVKLLGWPSTRRYRYVGNRSEGRSLRSRAGRDASKQS